MKNEIACKPPAPYTCFAISPNRRILLAGLENGSVIAFGSNYSLY